MSTSLASSPKTDIPLLPPSSLLSSGSVQQQLDFGPFLQNWIPKTLAVQSVRVAARSNAAKVSQKEHDALKAERLSLLEKKYESSLMPSEEGRLEYVRWSLDRIEDAKYGQPVDALEDLVSKYHQALKELQHLSLTLQGHLPAKRR